eukprot:1145315-Pelagomonas_calceolata.AAC.1
MASRERTMKADKARCSSALKKPFSCVAEAELACFSRKAIAGHSHKRYCRDDALESCAHSIQFHS